MSSVEFWRKQTVVALKKALQERGAKVSGRKEDLVNRVMDWDRNSNFKGPDISWPSKGFKSTV